MATDLKTAVGSVGIFLTMLGVYMVYVNSPINYTIVDGGLVGAGGPSWEEVQRKATRRNTFLKVGVYLILGGSFVQLVANFIPANTPAA